MAFAIAPSLTIDVVPVGASGEPVLVIDDVAEGAAALRGAACAVRPWQAMPPGSFPGLRAGLPAAYARALIARLHNPIVNRLLGGGTMKVVRFECSFSMVTLSPAELTPLQRVPHIDVARPDRVAIMHFLCGAPFGGTAFYRQVETGLEQVGPETRERYIAARTAGLARLRPEDGYPGADVPGYARTAAIAARFNRVLAYRSCTLHSGVIEDTSLLSPDPARGRLVATFFVDYAPA
ncbi:DUF6445 family protein [Falsiroseomonas bella]|nr:DUF6445 family protein [Falsiroseomonas bella]